MYNLILFLLLSLPTLVSSTEIKFTPGDNSGEAASAPRSQREWDRRGITRPDYGKTDAEVWAEKMEYYKEVREEGWSKETPSAVLYSNVSPLLRSQTLPSFVTFRSFIMLVSIIVTLYLFKKFHLDRVKGLSSNEVEEARRRRLERFGGGEGGGGGKKQTYEVRMGMRGG